MRLVSADVGAPVVLMLMTVTSDVEALLKDVSAGDVVSDTEKLNELLGSALDDEADSIDVIDRELKVTVGTKDDSDRDSLLTSDETLGTLESDADEMTEAVELKLLKTEDNETVP